MSKAGTYIVIEGTDGTGKSTQADILEKHLIELGHKVTKFHEPAGVPIATELRKVIVDSTLERSSLTNVLLFTAARRENWYQLALPALERGECVVVTRNYYSTLAYQAIADGIGHNTHQDELIDYVERLTLEATSQRYTTPDVSVILDVNDEKERVRRITQRGDLDTPDTFESRENDFQHRVLEGYRVIAERKNIPLISATKTPEEVAKEVWDIVSKKLG